MDPLHRNSAFAIAVRDFVKNYCDGDEYIAAMRLRELADRLEQDAFEKETVEGVKHEEKHT